MIEITSTIHVSNYCSLRKKCAYCGFAVGTSIDGYYFLTEKKENEVKLAARVIEDSGIGRVSISAGYGNFYKVLRALEIIKENTSLKVLINVGGDLNRERIRTLKSAGVDTICCNLETVNKTLFKKLKPSDSLENRLRVCYLIKEEEVELSSGILLGIGESEEDRNQHIEILKKMDVEEIPVMRFIPYKGTPMEKMSPISVDLLISVIKKVKKSIKGLKRLTVPFPTISKEDLLPVINAGATNIATVVPKNYPLLIKGVASPKVGILEEILEVLKNSGIKTNVGKRVGAF